MYCVKCGVEMSEDLKACPLCNTVVFHPEISLVKKEPMYPPKEGEERFSPSGVMFVVSSFFLLAAVICLLCDWNIFRTITWSGFVLGGILLLYIALVLPFWFRKPNPVIFVPVFFVACLLYLLYVDLQLQGGWFLSFAFPVAGGIGALISTVVILIRVLKRGRLYIFSGACIFLGGFSLLAEFLLDITFGTFTGFEWAFYPLTVLVFFGLMLLVIAICRPLRDSLRKKLFL